MFDTQKKKKTTKKKISVDSSHEPLMSYQTSHQGAMSSEQGTVEWGAFWHHFFYSFSTPFKFNELLLNMRWLKKGTQSIAYHVSYCKFKFISSQSFNGPVFFLFLQIERVEEAALPRSDLIWMWKTFGCQTYCESRIAWTGELTGKETHWLKPITMAIWQFNDKSKRKTYSEICE